MVLAQIRRKRDMKNMFVSSQSKLVKKSFCSSAPDDVEKKNEPRQESSFLYKAIADNSNPSAGMLSSSKAGSPLSTASRVSYYKEVCK